MGDYRLLMVVVVVDVLKTVGVRPEAAWLAVLFCSFVGDVEGSTIHGSGGGGGRSGSFIGGGGGGFWASYTPSNVVIAVAVTVTALAGTALAATLLYSNR